MAWPLLTPGLGIARMLMARTRRLWLIVVEKEDAETEAEGGAYQGES